MTYTRDWSETTPIDHTKFNVQPGAVRDTKTDVAERLQTMFYGFIAGETETGAKYLEYKDQGSDPSAPAATYSRIYFKSGSLYIRNATAIYQISQGGVLSFVKAADVASATTTDIGAALGQFLDITGTTTITGLGTIAAGIQRDVRFTGILTLTHNATSLILPTSANITTANGDTARFVSLGSGNWKCLSYQKVDGTPLTQPIQAVTGGYKNLSISRTNATTVAITADELVLNNGTKLSSVSFSVAITTSGVGGLDTGAEASNTWYYIYALSASTGIISTSSSAPSGQTVYALIGAVRNDGSSNFVDFTQTNRIYSYSSSQSMASGNVGLGSWTSITTSSYVPSSLSNFAFGSLVTPANTSEITNDNSITINVFTQRDEVGQSSIPSSLQWRFRIKTADTLYWGSNNASASVFISGFEITKLV